MHPNVQRVAAAGAAMGVEVTPREFPEGTRTAEDAARAIGCDLVQIVKSLVFTLDAELVLALVAGTNRLDETRLAAALGGTAVGRADAAAVKAATGYAIGGVPPFGHASPLRRSSTRTCSPSTRCGPRPARRTTCSRSRRSSCCG
jgi:prolyl-tRNA editing enzyme YbaK/EbsC (Cys-tRNA(Pro) deacylase)